MQLAKGAVFLISFSLSLSLSLSLLCAQKAIEDFIKAKKQKGTLIDRVT